MNNLNLNLKIKGYKNHVNYSLETYKNSIVGNIDYKLDIFISNKYILNRYFKFNSKLPNNTYDNILYNYKKIND